METLAVPLLEIQVANKEGNNLQVVHQFSTFWTEIYLMKYPTTYTIYNIFGENAIPELLMMTITGFEHGTFTINMSDNGGDLGLLN